MCGRRSREGVNWGPCMDTCDTLPFILTIYFSKSMALLEVQFGEMWHLLGGLVIFFYFWKGPYPAFMRFKCTNSSCWACASGAAKGQWHLWLPSVSMHACLCVSDSRFRQQSRVVMTKGSCKAREESEWAGREGFVLGCFHFASFCAKLFLGWWNSLAFS